MQWIGNVLKRFADPVLLFDAPSAFASPTRALVAEVSTQRVVGCSGSDERAAGRQ